MAYMKKRSAEAMGVDTPTATGFSFGAFWDAVKTGIASVVSPCAPGLVYEPFYDSCVTPCPPGKSYDHNDGICKGPSSAGVVAPCVPPLVYEPFYDSCVNPCPPGQTYDHSDGICKAPSAGLSTTAKAAIGVGIVAGIIYLNKKKRRRR